MALTYSVIVGTKSTAGSLANWVNRSDLPSSIILEEAEAWIYQRLRVREMRTDVAFTFDEGESSETLPDGFLDPIQFLPYGWGDPLLYYHEEMFRPVRDENGDLYESTPSRWTIIGETAHVDVTCDADFGGRLLYYAQPDALSASNTTNFLTRRYPTLLRHALMHKAYEHMKDTQRAQAYEVSAMQKLADAMQTDDMARRGQHAPA